MGEINDDKLRCETSKTYKYWYEKSNLVKMPKNTTFGKVSLEIAVIVSKIQNNNLHISYPILMLIIQPEMWVSFLEHKLILVFQ